MRYKLEPPKIHARGDGWVIWTAVYPSNHSLAVMIERMKDEAAALALPGHPEVLSVNMDHGQDHESKDLPENCFYVREWSVGEVLADFALTTGWFKVRDDLPTSHSGFVRAAAWELLKEKAA